MDRLATISRLTLGSAQLGMRYGVVNAVGDPGMEGALAVMDAAWKAGVTCIDTARVYGDAEARIGAWRGSRGHSPVLISKLPKLSNPDSPADIEKPFAQSASALGVDRIDGYLCHSPANLKNDIVLATLARLRSEGRIGRFGATIYSEAELDEALAVPELDMAQLPVSLANPRFATSGAIAAAAARGILIFVRSVYLQGVLLTPPDRLPAWLTALSNPLRRLHDLAAEAAVDVPTLALAAVNSIPGVHSIVIGAETPGQIEQSVRSLRVAALKPGVIETAWSLFKDVPAELSDPSRWPAH